MISLMRRIFTMPFPWNIWVMFLAMVNLIGGIAFFSTPEGKFALIAMMGAMIVMQIVYTKRGFVRLLGLGHILFWVPFAAWSIWRLSIGKDLPNDFKAWLLLVTSLNCISLAIDALDLYRYITGDKNEIGMKN